MPRFRASVFLYPTRINWPEVSLMRNGETMGFQTSRFKASPKKLHASSMRTPAGLAPVQSLGSG